MMVVQLLVYALLEAHEVDPYIIVDFALFCGLVGTRSFWPWAALLVYSVLRVAQNFAFGLDR